MKILSEFQSVKEHQSFIASLTKEKDIKNRIKDLMRMRKNGITKISDSVEFEVQRVRRNNRKKNEKRRLQQNAILGEHAAELNMSMTLAPSPLSIKSEDLGSAAPSPAQPIFGALPSSPKIDDKVWFILKMLMKTLKPLAIAENQVSLINQAYEKQQYGNRLWQRVTSPREKYYRLITFFKITNTFMENQIVTTNYW